MRGHAKVTIEGVGMGILFNNPAGMLQKPTTAKKVIPTPEEAADRSCYWNDNKTELMFPTWNIYSGIVQAASGLKLLSNKKKALAPVVAGDISLSPVFVGFGTKNYKIDSRRAVVQRQGIIRSRAWLPEWKLTFEIDWETSTLGVDFHKGLLPELLTTLGESIGIGDFRPAKRGPFGKFRVVSIE